MTRDLLLEIGTEDLPARYVAPLSEALAEGLCNGLRKRGVEPGAVQQFSTPRRIAVLIESVNAQQPEQTLERTGPALKAAMKDGQPTPAGLGFARSCGVDFAVLGEKDGKLHFVQTSPGRQTVELLPEILIETFQQMDTLVPKRMRWGAGDATFVRPVQWLTCLFGADVVPLEAFGQSAGRVTYGHRFHAPAAIELASPANYTASLKQAKVWADAGSRRDAIRELVQTEAARIGGVARINADLLDEVTALVEWPAPITGRMEDRFMQLPPEVIVSTVETNQRYFTVFTDNSYRQLLPWFITIANIESNDPSQVIAGNERVVRPRLSDALFFWEQDLKQPLEAYGVRLQTVTFQKDLGSIADKVGRIRKLAAHLASGLNVSPDLAERAAALCKCDLVTRMVFEFPELQGLMGGYYASQCGEPDAVATAIREHYLPTQHGTPIPSTIEGRLVALCDKLDTLTGIFAIGQKPSASKDPYALRRAALGALRICLEAELPLDLRDLLQTALEQHTAGVRDDSMLRELLDFVGERLRAYLVGQTFDGGAISAEMFESVAAMQITQPLDFLRRLRAVHAFTREAAAGNLAAANKRIRNILRAAELDTATPAVDPARFEHDEERTLFAELGRLETLNAAAADYHTQLVNLSSLREPVDAFFEAVMVNADDPAVRGNRLALLAQLDRLCRSVADLSCLPG
ncbi:glycine--tRNA ligase subunit beta [Sinimarinibacterium sp. CAU 1509]|uniref:glycine--tRNA ligase subunit beta n=1 Tax=Sinimarinibacterium sp. CAU 1509 TaxID=2562283 RepID=UPI0010AB7A91|nr:glycine--tRNA ligase subunit beta [Sinimarinibacterium sp. CAU 1509]TJY59875.1 glycine--tRNA ligase subunit beta [Sinimarinibacterium sp. CAU 1509]